jgi:gamma-glutamylcyclotransferase (GGCT)/AIG2-like uncharacterized protein YtfP
VYGTLAPGRTNHGMLAPLNGVWTDGSIAGYRIDAGWGATHGFPGVRLDPDGAEIAVQVFASGDLPAHWERLDAFEGAEYERVLVEVRHAEGVLLANIYVIR